MTRTVRGVLAVAAVAAALTMASGIRAADWPQFRGLQRDGISAETGLLKKWPEAGPKEAWRRSIGEGYSSIAVAGGRLYTMDAGDHEGVPTEFAIAIDPANGKEIWRTPIGKKTVTEFGNGPRATPAVQGDIVYVFGAQGTLAALSAKDGSVRWKIEATEAFGAKVPHWGYSGSVLVDNGLVILEGGGREGKSFAGVDAKTGKVVWTTGDAGPEPGYNSPLAVTIGGKRQYIHFIGAKLAAHDASGKEIWSHPWPQGETHAMPLFVPPDKIFGSGVEGIGATMFQIENGAAGVSVKELWKNATFRTHFNASVLHGDHLYGFDNTSFKCISAKDGSLAWVKRGLGKGSVILVDGHLLVLSDDGRLLLVEANTKEYVEKGVVQALKGDNRCWTPPAFANGRLYLRNHTEIVAYDLKG